jgi:dimethylsulfoniopropionate demethylase
MNSPLLSLSRRIRCTPFNHRVTDAGVKAYTVYNHMRLPTVFESIEADYHHLKRNVQVWDVACERQVEIRGPDAAKLAQYLSPRDLSRMADDQCYYLPMIDENGGMLNDPVFLKAGTNDAGNRYWISIADSDVLYWVKGMANGLGLDVDVFEPDVSPLAVQGPKADALMSRVFGKSVRDIHFFRHKTLTFEGHSFIVARSGYSKQGGYEIYVEDSSLGEPLWDALFAAGEDLNVRAGCPNLIERIEAGILSYGNDMTIENTPYEAGLGRFCNAPEDIDFIGKSALYNAKHPHQQIRGLLIQGQPVPPCTEPWVVDAAGVQVGQITSAMWSPDLNTNIGIGMIHTSHRNKGTSLTLHTPDGERHAEVTSLPFELPATA